MKKILIACFVAGAMLIPSIKVQCCTNVLVSKGATKDGSCMITYSADSHNLYGELYFHPAANWPAGTMLDIYDWDGGQYRGQIKQVSHTYQTVGNMNQYQLIITETTFGGLRLGNPNGIMDYGSLIYITLQRAKTAREAIAIMDQLTQEYGYPSGGESFSIADKNEVWIMEMIGKGEEKGTVWVARRVPDGYICAHANQSRIDKFPLNDPENCLYSKDVIEFARKKGLYNGKDADFSFCDTYNPIDFSGARACEARAWSAFNILCQGSFTWEDEKGVHTASANDFLDFVMGYKLDGEKMPLFVKPTEKVTLNALANVMRDHYEGTPMDMTEDVGAGVSRLPYRWRPMSFSVDGVEYVHERAIATQQTGFWLLGQSRGWLPDEIGGIIWFGVDDAATSPLTPVYTNVASVPEYFKVGNGSMIEYSPTSAFWQISKVTHFAYLFYDRVAPVIRTEIDKYAAECHDSVAATDSEALKLLNSGKKAEMVSLLTSATDKLATKMFNRWKELENELLVKFIDGNVKRQDENGKYLVNHESTIPASPEHPAQRERWLRAIVNDNGKTLKANE